MSKTWCIWYLDYYNYFILYLQNINLKKGIKGLGRMWLEIDDDRSRDLTFD